MQTKVALVLFILARLLTGAPVPRKENTAPNTNGEYLEISYIDGIDASKLPEKYKDIALMCDLYKKINILTDKYESDNVAPINAEDSASGELADFNIQKSVSLAENVKEWLKEVTFNKDEVRTNLSHLDNEKAVLTERVKRNSGNNIPTELLQMLKGVCVTDECLQVVREYFEWRKQNGYPVYTGVSEIG